MSSPFRRLVMAVLLLAAAGFVRLGLWQLDRLAERRAGNVAALAARAAPPVRLDRGVLPPVESLTDHRIVVGGRYDHAHDIVLRGQALQGVPGVRVITPLLPAGNDTAVLVDRGFVPAPDGVSVETERLREPGDVEVMGLVAPIAGGLSWSGDGGQALVRGGRTTWRQLDLAQLRERLPYPLRAFYLRQLPGPSLPSFPRRLAPPPIDDGPHLSYAIQWFLFAGLAAAFAFLVVGRRPRSGSRTSGGAV